MRSCKATQSKHTWQRAGDASILICLALVLVSCQKHQPSHSNNQRGCPQDTPRHRQQQSPCSPKPRQATLRTPDHQDLPPHSPAWHKSVCPVLLSLAGTKSWDKDDEGHLMLLPKEKVDGASHSCTHSTQSQDTGEALAGAHSSKDLPSPNHRHCPTLTLQMCLSLPGKGRDEAEEEQEQAGKAAKTVTTTAAARAVRHPPQCSRCRVPH